MVKHKLAVALGLVVFLVLTGGGVASALWSTTAKVTSTVEVASLSAACENPTSVINASFEEPVKTSLTQTPDRDVPGWIALPDHNIEIWVHNTHENVPAPVGRQFVELNAHLAGTLSQEIATTPGQTLQWSLLHRGRQGVDTMEVGIGAAGGTPVRQATISDGQTWKRYSGIYVVPAGQTSTELSFKAISTSTGDVSIGNFLDDVSFGSGPCLMATSTVKNTTRPGDPIRVGDVVEYVTTVKNTGSVPSFDAVLSNQLPPTLNYMAGSLRVETANPTDAADADQAEAVNGLLTARLGTGIAGPIGGTIAQGTETTFTFRATVLPNSAGTTIHYTPSVTYVNNLAPNWLQTTTAPDVSFNVPMGADLALSDIVMTPATMNPGSSTPVTWTIKAGNNGPLAAGAGSIRVTLPVGYTSGVVSAAGASCTGSGAVRTCSFPSLAVGAEITITVTRTVTNPTVGLTVSAEAVLAGSPIDLVPGNNTATGTITIKDTQKPTVPGTPTVTSNSGTQVSFGWGASTDNVAVVSYEVYRNNQLIDTVTTRSFTDSVVGWSTYTYTVKARDAAGNVSDPSGQLPVSTVPGGLDTTSGFKLSQSSWYEYCLSPNSNNTAVTVDSNFLACWWSSSQARYWQFTPTGDGFAKVNLYGTPTRVWLVSGSNVNLAAPSNSTAQEWKITANGNGFRFESRSQVGQCVERISGSSIELRPCDENSAAQRWAATAR